MDHKCIHCNEVMDESKEIMACDCCRKKLHIGCSGLAGTEKACLKLKSRLLTYYCNFCKNNISQVPNLITVIETLTQQISDLTNKMNEQEKLFDLSNTNKDKSVDVNVIIEEINERLARRRNVIIYNVQELKSNKTNERIDHDANKVKELLNPVITNPKFKVIRLGKNQIAVDGSKCRPLKVIFDDENSAANVLKNLSKLNLSTYKIRNDLTALQREHICKVYSELEERKKLGEVNIAVKFFHGVPQIVCETEKNSKN